MRIKLTIIAIITAVFIAPSFADNAKTTTSKGYVDTQIATKQDKVPAVDTNTVITTTNTTGEIGEKAIYDANGNYATQTDALVTAADANAAVQNAIDNEFVCVEWAPNTDETPENCYIWKIQNVFHKSKNLFDISKITSSTNGGSGRVNNGDGTLSVTPTSGNSAIGTGKTLAKLAPGIEAEKTYTLSFDTTGKDKSTYFYCYGHTSDNWYWTSNTRNPATKTITANMLDCTMYFYANYPDLTPATISNIQIEEGSTATPYQPYGENTYMPIGN